MYLINAKMKKPITFRVKHLLKKLYIRYLITN